MKGEHYADSHMANICRLFPGGLRGWDWVVSRKFGRRLSFKGDLDTLNPFPETQSTLALSCHRAPQR
jgi:hypothetical protein